MLEAFVVIEGSQVFGWMVLLSLAAVLTAGLYVPIAGVDSASFEGDLIVVLFLLSIPALGYFLAGWISVGVYSVLGGHRALLQYFSYEVPFLMALAGPAGGMGCRPGVKGADDRVR